MDGEEFPREGSPDFSLPDEQPAKLDGIMVRALLDKNLQKRIVDFSVEMEGPTTFTAIATLVDVDREGPLAKAIEEQFKD